MSIELASILDSPAQRLRSRVATGRSVPFIGIYDVFSALLAAKHFEAVFCSGYGFTASYYGLPDAGFVSWTDLLAFVGRVRSVLPQTHILVDIDDGYADSNVAVEMVRRLEQVGASGVIFEDQGRPKKCGHLGGKTVVSAEEHLRRLSLALQSRRDMFVIARTDAADASEGIQRAVAYADAGADAVLIEGIRDIATVRRAADALGGRTPIAVNLIGGGRTGAVSISELADAGAQLVVYSTPCLFAAHQAMDLALTTLVEDDGRLRDSHGAIDLSANNRFLEEHLRRVHEGSRMIQEI